MALPATTVWETRASPGDDLNSGSFVPGGSGTDYSQQNFAQVVFDGVTVTAATAGVSNTITIAGYTVQSTDVNNTLNLASGTNFTAGTYHIASVNTGANTWTLDRNCTSGVGAAMVGRMGGAKKTLDATLDSVVAGNTVWATGTFAEAVTLSVAGSSSAPIQVKGYTSVRGDNGQATITGSNSRARCVDFGSGATSYWFFNFIITAATSALFGTRDSTGARFQNCEITSGSSQVPLGTVISGFSGTGMNFINCHLHNLSNFGGVPSPDAFGCKIHNINATPLVIPNFNGSTLSDNLIYDCNGWGIDAANNLAVIAERNTIYDCSSGGIRINGASQEGSRVMNNIIVSNGSLGISVTNAPSGSLDWMVGHNAFYGQATPQNTARYPVYLGNDVTLSADPFVDAANGDFTLTDLAISEMQGFMFPNNFGSPNTQYGVMGAIQPQGGSSGGSNSFSYVC